MTSEPRYVGRAACGWSRTVDGFPSHFTSKSQMRVYGTSNFGTWWLGRRPGGMRVEMREACETTIYQQLPPRSTCKFISQSSSNELAPAKNIQESNEMANADTKIAQIEAIIGYTFTKKLLCAEGLQMDGTPGCVWLGRTPHMVEKNTRLAVLGDAIMASVLVEKWYDHRNAQGTSRTPKFRRCTTLT